MLAHPMASLSTYFESPSSTVANKKHARHFVHKAPAVPKNTSCSEQGPGTFVFETTTTLQKSISLLCPGALLHIGRSALPPNPMRKAAAESSQAQLLGILG